MTDNNNGNGADQFDRLAVIQELETLKLQVARYETEIKPLADRELQRIREQAVKGYELTEAQAQVMADRLAELTNEQAINETALQLAGQFRATDKPAYVNPMMGMNHGMHRPKQVNTQYELGKKQAHATINNRIGKQVSSVHIPAQPLSRFNVPRKGVLGRWVNKLR